jgi:hypothetical protein
MQGREGTAHHDILEQTRAFEARDPSRQALAYPEMPRFPGDLIAELEETDGDAVYRTLARAPSGT